MKKYTKVQMMAKNAPTGSYAAGCPADHRGNHGGVGDPYSCVNCERTE